MIIVLLVWLVGTVGSQFGRAERAVQIEVPRGFVFLVYTKKDGYAVISPLSLSLSNKNLS